MNDLKESENNSAPATGTDKDMLIGLQRETFDFFLKETDSVTGLINDKTQPGSPASISATGMGLTIFIAGVENNFITRGDAIERITKTLRFFYNSKQGTEADATGYKGFYYHFLKKVTGTRAWKSELSTIDTALLIMGVLSAASYFNKNNQAESDIRKLAHALYRRVDWQWALNNTTTICHGWNPEKGFLPYHWDDNYSEALLLYILALGSPTYPISKKGYEKWTATFDIKQMYGIEYLYAGPLFIHQFSQMWIDFRGIQDAFNRKAGFDYFENSKRATHVHQQYAIHNPHGFKHYGEFCWGQTASDGPGFKKIMVDGKERLFYGYIARGAPWGPDDGTVSPWTVVASLPFAPEIVLDTIRHAIEKLNLKPRHHYGFDASFNPTYPEKKDNPNGWVSPWRFGINQGPIIIMIENYHTGLIWQVMRHCAYIQNGLRIAGFTGGWLDTAQEGTDLKDA